MFRFTIFEFQKQLLNIGVNFHETDLHTVCSGLAGHYLSAIARKKKPLIKKCLYIHLHTLVNH